VARLSPGADRSIDDRSIAYRSIVDRIIEVRTAAGAAP